MATKGQSNNPKINIEMGVDASGVKDGTKVAKDSINELSQALDQQSKKATESFNKTQEAADQTGVGIKKVIQEQKKLAEEAEKTAKRQERATNSIIAAVQRSTAELEAGGKGTAAYQQKIAEQRGADLTKLEPYLAKLREIEKANESVNGSLGKGSKQLNEFGQTAKATAAALRQVPAQFTDIVVSLQGGQAPLTVLLQQGGQLKDIFGSAGAAARALGGYIAGLINPFTLAAAATGALYLAYESGQKTVREFNKLMIDTRDSVGYTTSQLLGMAEAISAHGFSRNDVAVAMSAIAKSTTLARSDLKAFTQTALELEKYAGVSIEKTSDALKRLASEPSKTAKEMGLLSASQYELVKSLEEIGKKTEAASIALKAYGDDSKRIIAGYKADMDALDIAVQFWTETWKKYWDAASGKTIGDTADQRIDNLKKKIAELGSVNPFRNLSLSDSLSAAVDPEGTKKRLIAQYSEELNYITRINEEMKRKAKADDEASRAADKGKSAIDSLTSANDKFATSQEKANKELAAYRRSLEDLRKVNPQSALLDPKLIKRTETGIMSQIQTPAGQDELASIEAKITATRKYLKELETETIQKAKLNEGEKLSLQYAEQLQAGLFGVARANKEAAKAAADRLGVELRKVEVREVTIKVGLKTDELLASSKELAKSLEDDFTMVGKSRLEQQNITTQRQIQLKYAKELRDLETKKDLLAPETFQSEKEKIKLAETTEKFANLKKTIRESAEIDTAKLSGMFDGALDGAFKFADALNNVIEVQMRLNEAQRLNAIENKNDPAKMAKEQAKLMQDSARASISAYGSMIVGLRSYAKEGTRAYDALYNAEKVLRAFELASSVETMAKKIGLLDLFTTKKLASDSATLTSGLAAIGKETLAFFGLGQQKAATAVANQGAQGDFVTAFPRMAAVAAMMAGLGFLTGAIGGGGGGGAAPTNEGKGTVFGDTGKASESLKNSLDILNSTQDVALNYTREMAMSLRTIEQQIGGVANLYLRSTGITDLTGSIPTGKFDTTASNLMNSVFRALPSFLAPLTGVLSGINTSLFGKSVSVTGSGISANSQLLKDIMSQGFQGQYYADVQTKKKLFGFSYSTSTSTQYSQLDSELKQQFSAIFRSVGNTVMTAADLLQVETSAVNKRLQEYVVSIGRIDLQGLSGEAIASKLEAVFGAESDKIARAAIAGFESIQQVGEGYFETLSRVAAQFELVRVYTERLGDTMQMTGVSGGLLADSIINAFGGISEYQSAVQQYYEDFFTAEQRGADAIIEMTRAMSYMGESVPETTQGFKDLVNAQDLTTESGRKAYATLISLSPAFAEMIQAAEDLKAGYRDAVFTSAEMTAFNAQSVRDQFKTLGIVGQNVPESIAGLRALVDAQDESTDAGKRLKFALMALAPTFVDVITAQEAARQEILDAEKAAQDKITSERQSLEKQLLTATGNTAEIRRLELESLDASNRALQERIWALEDEKKAQQELAAASSGIVSEIDRLKKSLSGSTEAQSAAALQAQFATTTAQARSGDLTALAKLPTISSALDQAFQLTATTASEVARMKGFLAGSLAETLAVLGAGSADAVAKTVAAVDLSQTATTDGLELTPTSTTAGLMSGASSTAVLIEEISALRIDNQAQARAIVQLQSRFTKVVERWDLDGLPETRAVV